MEDAGLSGAMGPCYINDNRRLAMGMPGASQRIGPNPQGWCDIGGESKFAVPFREQAQVPRWDPKPFSSGRGQALAVASDWEPSRLRKGGAEVRTKGKSSMPTCYLCSEHGADDSQSSESNSQITSSDVTRNKESRQRLVGLSVLAVLLLSTLVVVTVTMSRIIFVPLDTESPDETADAQLVGFKRAGPDSAHPDSLRPDILLHSRPSVEDKEESDIEDGLYIDSEREDREVTHNPAMEGATDPGDNSDATRSLGDALGRSYTKTGNPNCQSVVYTYCTVSRLEFHYRASVNACVVASLGPVMRLCARGKNRFASLADCEKNCAFGERLRDACFETPLFTGCNREDMRESWWYYDGGRCHMWTFPASMCPSNGSAVFATAAECAGQCTGHRGQRQPSCGKPRAVPCERRHPRFPYFAYFSVSEGRATCLNSSVAVTSAHRCLTGANRFSSMADCNQACASWRSSGGR